MMLKKAVSCLLSIVCVLLLGGVCFAQPVSSSDLIGRAKEYDGKSVTYEGEVIGEVMPRGKYAWVNVNDGANAVGIWVEQSLTADITYAGNYRARGDWVAVTGVFHRSCPEHGGDLDIHAQQLRKIAPGKAINERLNINKRNLAAVLLGLLCLVLILRLLRRA